MLLLAADSALFRTPVLSLERNRWTQADRETHNSLIST